MSQQAQASDALSQVSTLCLWKVNGQILSKLIIAYASHEFPTIVSSPRQLLWNKSILLSIQLDNRGGHRPMYLQFFNAPYIRCICKAQDYQRQWGSKRLNPRDLKLSLCKPSAFLECNNVSSHFYPACSKGLWEGVQNLTMAWTERFVGLSNSRNMLPEDAASSRTTNLQPTHVNRLWSWHGLHTCGCLKH